MNVRIFCLVAVSALTLCACEKTIINHGYVIEKGDLQKIREGASAQEVINILGSPTMTSTVQGSDGSFSWYYVSKDTEKNGFMNPKVVSQTTFKVLFDASGIVRKVETTDYENAVKAVGDETKTEGHMRGALSETFGGMGRYLKPYVNR